LAFDFFNDDAAPCSNAAAALSSCLDPATPVPCGSGCIGYGQARLRQVAAACPAAAHWLAALPLLHVVSSVQLLCCSLTTSELFLPACSAARVTPPRERSALLLQSALPMAARAVSAGACLMPPACLALTGHFVHAMATLPFAQIPCWMPQHTRLALPLFSPTLPSHSALPTLPSAQRARATPPRSCATGCASQLAPAVQATRMRACLAATPSMLQSRLAAAMEARAPPTPTVGLGALLGPKGEQLASVWPAVAEPRMLAPARFWRTLDFALVAHAAAANVHFGMPPPAAPCSLCSGVWAHLPIDLLQA